MLMLAVWLLIGLGGLLLLAASVRSTKERRCTGLEITISGSGRSLFIDEAEVRRILVEHVGSRVQGLPVAQFDLHAIEKAIRKDIWVKDASLFFNNNGALRIKVTEREPVARIFSRNGGSFYVDSSLMILPLSNLFSARLPVFTGFPTDHRVLIRRDSLLLRQVCDLSRFIQEDSLLSAMVEQVDITPSGEFEIVPKLGDMVIAFGDATNAAEKFRRILLFYKEVLLKGNMGRYNRISVKYDGQVVASQRGKEEIAADSLRTLELLKAIALESERKAGDSSQRFSNDYEKSSVDSSLIRNPVERETIEEATSKSSAAMKTATPAVTPVSPVNKNKPAVAAKKDLKKSKTAAPVVKQKKEERKPKVIMSKSNKKNKN